MSKPPSSPPFLNSFWPTLLLILAVLGIPATTVAVFLTQHVWLCVGLGLLYEVALIVFGFIGRVWQELTDQWVKPVAEWLNNQLQSNLSGYKKKYYDYLRNQHRDFDVGGLNFRGAYKLELDQIFVDLSIDTTTMEKATVNPVPQALREGSHAIWDFLASVPLQEQHFAIIGPPGSGKTTLLKHITLSILSYHQRHTKSQHGHIPHKLPILLFLRDHAKAIDKAANEQTPFTLIDALHEHLKKWEQPESPAGWFQRQLDKGQCLIMLDGLDEVGDLNVRKNVVDWVERQMKAYPRNRFILTSRPFGFRSTPVYNVTTLEVQPFTLSQVEQFVHKWYLAYEMMSKKKGDSGVHMKAKAGARELLQQLRGKPALLDLTVNPLLLTMITAIHYNGGKLPEKRITLYAEICTVFLGKRQEARGLKLELTPEQMQLVLEPLAYHMMTNNKRDINLNEVKPVIQEPLSRVHIQMTSETFLQLVENASGLLLLERESGVYSFAHLTFQEYLTATYMRAKNLSDTLVVKVKDSWWQETIRLYCAMADATPIIAACLAGDHPSAAVLELAIDCDKEARDVESSVRDRLNTIIEQGSEDSDPERQHVIAAALLSRRSRNMVLLKDRTYVDISLITCAEYQLFIDKQRERDKYLQPDHWISYHFLPGQGDAPVLGVRRSDAEAFCEWLTIREPGWQYRLPATGELKGEGLHERLPAEIVYWLNNKQSFAWEGRSLKLPNNVKREILDKLYRVRVRVRDLDRLLALNLDRTLVLDLDRTLFLNRTLDLALDRDLALVRLLDLDLNRAFAPLLAPLLDRARNRLLDLAYFFSPLSSRRGLKSFIPFGPQDKQEADIIQAFIVDAINIYLDLAILEQRIQGKLPACEGILIVKERQQELP